MIAGFHLRMWTAPDRYRGLFYTWGPCVMWPLFFPWTAIPAYASNKHTTHTRTVHVMRTYYAAMRTVRQQDSCARDVGIYGILSAFTKLNSRAGDKCVIRELCAVINSTRVNYYCTPCVRAYSHSGLMMKSPSIEQTRSLGALPTWNALWLEGRRVHS